jgi:hypothetical protein
MLEAAEGVVRISVIFSVCRIENTWKTEKKVIGDGDEIVVESAKPKQN